ncbi:MAG: NAD(P)H-hydrate epimerase [Pirellulaceae bacterium]
MYTDNYHLPPLSREAVRRIDTIAAERYQVPSICLMENAGRGAAIRIAQLTAARRTCILCGSGNNGGDGFVIARHLETYGVDVEVALLADPQKLKGDALTNWNIVQASKLRVHLMEKATEKDFTELLSRAELIVDALLGTGAEGDPRGVFATAIRRANARKAVRVAIDIPSGLDCDTGRPGIPCFHADHTCTFVAKKIGFDAISAQPFLGQVHVLPIGVPADLLRTKPFGP